MPPILPPASPQILTAHPNGHFYSPAVDPAELDIARIWPPAPGILGTDFDGAGHERILREVFPR